MKKVVFRNYGYVWWKFDLLIRIGPWQARLMHPYYGGLFGNGSRWFSGWHRWRDEPEY